MQVEGAYNWSSDDSFLIFLGLWKSKRSNQPDPGQKTHRANIIMSPARCKKIPSCTYLTPI